MDGAIYSVLPGQTIRRSSRNIKKITENAKKYSVEENGILRYFGSGFFKIRNIMEKVLRDGFCQAKYKEILRDPKYLEVSRKFFLIGL